MTTTARTIAEATVWTIREECMGTSAAMALCLTRCENSEYNEENDDYTFDFEDGSGITFIAVTETFTHDLEL